jgi:hypothetical protein
MPTFRHFGRSTAIMVYDRQHVRKLSLTMEFALLWERMLSRPTSSAWRWGGFSTSIQWKSITQSDPGGGKSSPIRPSLDPCSQRRLKEACEVGVDEIRRAKAPCVRPLDKVEASDPIPGLRKLHELHQMLLPPLGHCIGKVSHLFFHQGNILCLNPESPPRPVESCVQATGTGCHFRPDRPVTGNLGKTPQLPRPLQQSIGGERIHTDPETVQIHHLKGKLQATTRAQSRRHEDFTSLPQKAQHAAGVVAVYPSLQASR